MQRLIKQSSTAIAYKLLKGFTKVNFLTVMALFGLSACSHNNVSGEWDCPRQQGHGCINISTADKIAVEKLEPIGTGINKPGNLQKIWFAPYVDSEGNRHEASVVYYPQSNP